MISKRLHLLLIGLLLLALVIPVGLVMAQGPGGGGGPPEDKPGGGGGGPPSGTPGGPPAGEMVDVKGCAYFDEILGVWRLRAPDTELGYPNCVGENSATDWKLDFGPEGYCPDPCLISDLILDEFSAPDQVVTIKIGKNLVGTFKCIEYNNGCLDVLAQTDEDGPARKTYEWIPLTPAEGTDYGRPIEGKWVRAYGRAGETEYAVLVWEIRYPNTPGLPTDYGKWFWWRTSGQPWAKMWLLNCATPGEE